MRSSRSASPSTATTRIAIDYFGRTAGVGKREEEFTFAEHIAQTKLGYLTQDVAAAVRELRVGAGSERRPVFTIGFCFGGSNSCCRRQAGTGSTAPSASTDTPRERGATDRRRPSTASPSSNARSWR